MIILGIETACDDTAVALVLNGHNVLASVVRSEPKGHEKHGGVVPEVAARAHVDLIIPVIEEALREAGISLKQIDAIAVNNRHGLLRSIVIGVAAAKALSYVLNVPLVPIHHIEGHIYSPMLEHHDLPWPHVCLTVSGGHNLLLYAQEHSRYELIGRTLDDSAGEAFDKLARRLGLGFPGGLQIERLAAKGNPKAFNLPRPLLLQGVFDFSFSGLKTAVTDLLSEMEKEGERFALEDIAASFQEAVIDVLVGKAVSAVQKTRVSTLTLAGGVAANNPLRDRLVKVGKKQNFNVIYPSIKYCTDNAAMIACAAFYKGLKVEAVSDLWLDAWANAPLGDLNIEYTTKMKR